MPPFSPSSLCPSHGQVVPLDSPVAVMDRLEAWLADLAVEMAHTLKLQVTECLKVGSKLDAFPSQVRAALRV